MMKKVWNKFKLLKIICFVLFMIFPLFINNLQTYCQESFRNEKCKIELTLTNDAVIPADYKIINHGKFNNYKVFNYSLPVNSRIRITVYNNLGEDMAVILDEVEKAGSYVLKWDPDNACGGVYFYKMMAAPVDGNGSIFCITKKLIIDTPIENIVRSRIAGY